MASSSATSMRWSAAPLLNLIFLLFVICASDLSGVLAVAIVAQGESESAVVQAVVAGASQLPTLHEKPEAEPHVFSNLMNAGDGGSDNTMPPLSMSPPADCDDIDAAMPTIDVSMAPRVNAGGNPSTAPDATAASVTGEGRASSQGDALPPPAPRSSDADVNKLHRMIDASEDGSGESNEAYIRERNEANMRRPEALRHKKLSDIWENETPCECPFNRWKPVCGVDGNTYPNECFAECIDMKIFVHADCKYVKKELWARFHAQYMNGQRPFEYADELCEQGNDDGIDLRTKCGRSGGSYPDGFGPPPEAQLQDIEVADDADGPSSTINSAASVGANIHLQSSATALRGMPTSSSASSASRPGVAPSINNRGTDDHTTQNSEDGEEASSPKIVTRTFHGQRVPFYNRPVEDPCPACSKVYSPVCGEDKLTYPSACFAKCVGAVVVAAGECLEH